MDQEIKISIIIPVYKVEEYLDRCVESVVNQTYRNLEIIVVDDGSPDCCPRMCDNWEKKDNRINVIHKENGGLSSARNAGLEIASGNYIYFLDSDDVIPKHCIETLVKPLLSNDYDIVVGDFSILGNDRGRFGGIMDMRSNDEIMESYAKAKWYVFSCNKLYKRSFIKKNVLCFRKDILHEDVLWSFQVACLANSMYVTNYVTYYYRIRQDSISRANNIDKRIMGLLIAFQEMYDFQYKQQRFEYLVDCAIRRFFPLFEETMRQLPSFSLWDFYKKIRVADCRTMSQKRCVYNTVTRKLRYLDYFFPVSIGFMYRYFCWRLVCIKAGHANIPFIY